MPVLTISSNRAIENAGIIDAARHAAAGAADGAGQNFSVFPNGPPLSGRSNGSK